MNVLETFIHDPLVEWTKSHKSSGIEVQNPHAQVCVYIIFLQQKIRVTVDVSPTISQYGSTLVDLKLLYAFICGVIYYKKVLSSNSIL